MDGCGYVTYIPNHQLEVPKYGPYNPALIKSDEDMLKAVSQDSKGLICCLLDTVLSEPSFGQALF